MAKYWVEGSGDWSDTAHWDADSGGAGGDSVPIATDDVIIDDQSGISGGTITCSANPHVGCHDFTSTTGFSYTIDKSGQFVSIPIYGSLTLESGITFGTGFVINIVSPDTGETITTEGVTIPQMNIGDSLQPTASYTLLDDLTVTGSLRIYNGTFDANDFSVTAGNISFWGQTGFFTPTIIMGSGVWLTGSWDAQSQDYSDAITIVPETSLIVFISGSFSSNIFDGGSKIYNDFMIVGTDKLIIRGSNTFNEFEVDETPVEIWFQQGITTTFLVAPNLLGVMGSNITISSVSDFDPNVEGDQQHYLSFSSGTVQCDYLDISNSNAMGGATWNAGANSIDTTNNDGWIFATTPTTPVVDDILISYKEGDTYGVKRVDPDTKGVGTYYSLDLVAPKEFARPLLWKSVVLQTKPMPEGTSIELYYEINKNGEWIQATMVDGVESFTEGNEAIFLIGAEGMIFGFGLVLNPCANETPEIYLPIYINFE
jgi:hypothetical protein